MAKVTMLTMISRKPVAIRRLMMNTITACGAGARPPAGRQRHPLPSLCAPPTLNWLLLRSKHAVVVHPVVRIDVDVRQLRGAVEQRLGVARRQQDRVLADLPVGLVGEGLPLRLAAGRLQGVEQGVDQ